MPLIHFLRIFDVALALSELRIQSSLDYMIPFVYNYESTEDHVL